MLGLKLIHVSKRGPWMIDISSDARIDSKHSLFRNGTYMTEHDFFNFCFYAFFIYKLPGHHSQQMAIYIQTPQQIHVHNVSFTLGFRKNMHKLRIGARDTIIYHKTSNIRHTKSKKLKVSRLVFQLSLPYPLKSGVKSRMKMWLEQRRQALLQLHLSDQQFYGLLRCVLY